MSVYTYTLTSGTVAAVNLSVSPADAFIAGLLLICCALIGVKLLSARRAQ